jgi:predicted short-subunit dehydrogenase-like oxidoreductase (DUF2520 family)
MAETITFIGAGNLATHVSLALHEKGYQIAQVYSRTEKSAASLAERLDASYTISAESINQDADIFIVALKDSAIVPVLSEIDFKDKLLIHCSGSTPISVLKEFSNNYGVFYPLQTFSKNRKLNLRKIPVFVEANSESNQKRIERLAQSISDSVSVLNSEKRMALHIAAVFACNFVNHFYNLASEILESEEIPFNVLRPLILETAEKVQEMHPREAQTGPAVRFDENIISRHLQELKGKKNYDKLYSLISKSIFEHHQKNKEWHSKKN